MPEYEITVHTRVKETYYVEAESEQEALKHWSDKEPVQSECIDIEDVSVTEATDD